MTKFFAALTRLVRDEQGTEATSIALGIVLIALVAGLGMVEFGESLMNFFDNVGGQIEGAGDEPGLPDIPTGPSGGTP